MKKKAKLKWLTMSIFALGVISVVPIVTTSCSSDNADNSNDEGEENTTNNENTSPVNNTDGNYQTYNGNTLENTLEFVGYYGVSGLTIDDTVISDIVNVITPGYTLENIDVSGIWVYDEDASGNNSTTYNLTIASETDVEYAKHFISLSDVWYNRTTSESNGLSIELDQNDINYDVLLDWNVTISLNYNDDYSYYQFTYTITPKYELNSEGNDQGSDTISYRFTLYSQYRFNNTFVIVSPGQSPVNDLENYIIDEDENVYKFAGYVTGTTEPSYDSMNYYAITIANGASGGELTSSAWSHDESSTYTLTSVEDVNISTLFSLSNIWNNYYSVNDNETRGEEFEVDSGFNYDALSSWDVSISATIDADNSSWWFTLLITPNEYNTLEVSYQFILFSEYDYNTTFGIVTTDTE